MIIQVITNHFALNVHSDIIFFIKSLKIPTDAFNIMDYVKFDSANTYIGPKKHGKMYHDHNSGL